MKKEYYDKTKEKLTKSLLRAKSKYPKNTQLQLTDKQLEDLLYLWTFQAKNVWLID